jgi:hypothetical protein
VAAEDTRIFLASQIREAQAANEKALHRVETKVEKIDTDLTRHLIAYGPEKTALEKDVNGLGKRLDSHVEQHNERKKWTWGLGASMVLLLGKAIWDLVAAKFGGK